jgi:uncharacterized protein (TIGR03435 family)
MKRGTLTVVSVGLVTVVAACHMDAIEREAPQGEIRKTYNLVVTGGALGPHLRQASRSCNELRASATVTNAPDSAASNPCGLNRGIGHIEAHGLPLDDLAGMIGSPNGFTVVNKTGLDGNYDWELVYTPDNLRNHPADKFKDVDPNGPSIFDAVQQQLGLKLEPAR